MAPIISQQFTPCDFASFQDKLMSGITKHESKTTHVQNEYTEGFGTTYYMQNAHAINVYTKCSANDSLIPHDTYIWDFF